MRLIYGRAGTGKSEYIFKNIKKNCTEKTYIITPEQFSFSAEKRLMDTIENGATTAIEVLSFERMAYRVIKEMCDKDKKNIGKSGKCMIIYDAINNHQRDLKFLGKSIENVDLIITQVTEFKKHNISVEMLQKQVDECNDEYLKAKLNDMLIMYKELEDKIVNFVDENDLLNILAKNIEASHLFDGCVFYIDEFSGFTKQEYEIIRELNKIAKEVYITVCSDDLKITRAPDSDIFYDNKQTIQSLINTLPELEVNNFNKDEQIKLTNAYRFKNEELAHLEKNIYDFPYKIYNNELKNIELYLAENQYSEIAHVASKIVQLVRDDGYRYKEITVISKNLDSYSNLCKAIFDEYEIPIFIDEKKDITQNIFIKYILAILEIFDKNWSYEAMFNYLKTGLVPVENIFEIENYCLKLGIKGSKWYKEEWKEFGNEQKKIVAPLIKLKNELAGRKNAEQITKNLYNFLCENIDIKSQNDEITECWNLIIDLFDEIISIFAKQEMTFNEYENILKTGLATKELGQIPQTQDKVTIGDVDRSRTHKVKAVFIIGVNDGVFPSISSSEGFFNDKDRDRLKGEGLELAKGTVEKSYEENFNIYKAFSLSEEKLFISYSAADYDGGALRKSILIGRIKKIFPKMQEQSSQNDILQNEILTKKVTFSKLLDNLEYENWYEVYKWYEKNYPEKLSSALEGLKFSNVPEKINKENIEKLYGNKLNTSISKLEKYMSCPFSYYLKYGLKLSDKEKLDIKPIDTGSFMHDVIDRFFKEVPNVKKMDDDKIEQIIDEIVEEELENFQKFTANAKYKILVQRLKKIISISMKYIVESLKCSQFEVLGTEVSFGNTYSEINSDEDDTKGELVLESAKEKYKEQVQTYPPIEMKLDNGKKVSIVGKIDRIDIAKMPDGKYIRIIDYKSSTKDLDLNKVISGLQLQLLTYVDAVITNENKNGGDVFPAGALYFTLLEPKIASSNRDLSKEEVEELIKQNYRMHGVVLADVNIIKAMDNSIQSSSDVIPVSLNKNGTIAAKSNAVTREEFENLQKYTTKLIKQISNEILSGNIELKPFYNANGKYTPCSYCEYKSICSFDPKFKNNNYRYIANHKKQEILQEIIKGYNEK